ncbi:MAG: hypothetical protein QG594_1856 [Bacteroidota bacterium]|nr:hypothetical protein [Bacteroidota bacterium]
MIIEYKLDEKDFLTHQLFIASRSERIRKKRQKNKIIIPLIYVAIGLMSFFQDNYSTTIIFFIVAFFWFTMYPLWERRYYKKHYQAFISENYKDKIGRTATLEFDNDFILAKENGSESKVLTKELEEINEISTTIFIRLKGGQSFILPKDKIPRVENIKARLKELATYLNIKYDIDEKWEWK